MMTPEEQRQRYFQQQQRALYQQQAQQQRLYEQQQRNLQKVYAQQQRVLDRECRQKQREFERLDRQYSKYPKLNDNFVRICLVHAIHQLYTANNMPVPPIEELSRILKFRRIKSTQPEPYIFNNRKVFGIKHACKFRGVSINPIKTLPIIYVSPNGVKYNHDYNYKVYYYYCPKCHSVIYYFENNLMEGDTSFNGEQY